MVMAAMLTAPSEIKTAVLQTLLLSIQQRVAALLLAHQATTPT